MSMIKRLQIPITQEEEQLIKSAAKIYSISAAEWARRILRKAAERDTSSEIVLDPLEAVQKIADLSAPVDSIDKMKQQSVDKRLK